MDAAGGGGWWRSWWAADVGVAALVGAVMAADAWWNLPGTRQADAVTYLLLAVSVGAVLLRRRWPVPVAVACGAALAGWYLLGHRGELLNLATMVALYTVAAQGDRRRTVLAGLVAVPGSAALGWATEPASAPMAEMVWPAAALLLGEVVRGRRELAAEYAARQARAAADRERDARRRVQGERLRIARDFHDLVAHTMAAVNVQMGVAAAAFDRRPDAARSALQQARSASAEALAELRGVLSLLREDPGGAPAEWEADGELAAPAPGLDELDELVRRTGRAGVAVSLHRRTGGHAVPAGVALAVYRIVQEALTNVVRHARARSAAVSVTGDGAEVVVEVVDDGTGGRAADSAAGDAAGGYGLAGMAERAAVLGGTVESGPAPGGGFQVRAVLPAGRRAPAAGGRR